MRPRYDLRDLYARADGLLSPGFHDKHVAVFGAGAGSYLVEKLGRCGPRRLDVFDIDVVETPNLSRTAYEWTDIGRLKAQAMAERLRRATPWVDVRQHSDDVTALGDDDIDRLVGVPDLIISGGDRFELTARLNAYAVQRRIPIIFIDVHELGQGGRVVWTLPDVTGCYRCAAPERFEAFLQGGRSETDLDGGRALLADIQFVDAVALKVSLAILERQKNSALGRFFTAMRNRNDIVVRCAPDHAWSASIWSALLSGLPEQANGVQDASFAMDTLWFPVPPDPHCPVCGEGR